MRSGTWCFRHSRASMPLLAQVTLYPSLTRMRDQAARTWGSSSTSKIEYIFGHQLISFAFRRGPKWQETFQRKRQPPQVFVSAEYIFGCDSCRLQPNVHTRSMTTALHHNADIQLDRVKDRNGSISADRTDSVRCIQMQSPTLLHPDVDK